MNFLKIDNQYSLIERTQEHIPSLTEQQVQEISSAMYAIALNLLHKDASLVSVRKVSCKFLSSVTIEPSSIQEETNCIHNFISYLKINTCDKYHLEINNITKFINKEISISRNIGIRVLRNKIQEKFLNLLKKFKKADLVFLEENYKNENTSVILENIINLALIYKIIEMVNEGEGNSEYKRISLLHQALEETSKIHNEAARIQAFKWIGEEFIKLQENTSLLIANAIENDEIRYFTFLELGRRMLKQGKMVRVIKLIQAIENQGTRNRVYKELSHRLNLQGSMSEAQDALCKAYAKRTAIDYPPLTKEQVDGISSCLLQIISDRKDRSLASSARQTALDSSSLLTTENTPPTVEELSFLNGLASILNKNLRLGNTHSRQINSLINLANDHTIPACSLLKEKVLNVLKDLRPKDLNILRKIYYDEPVPKFFKNIFELVLIYNQLNFAKIEPEINIKINIIKNAYIGLISIGCIDSAIKMAETIEDSQIKSAVCSMLADMLMRRGKMSHAMRAALAGKIFKEKEIIHGIFAFMNPIAVSAFIQAAKTLKRPQSDYVLSIMAEKLLSQGGNLKTQTIEVFREIRDEFMPYSILQGLVKKYPNRILEIAKAINISEDSKDWLSGNIVRELIRLQKKDEAIKLAKSIKNTYIRENTLGYLVEAIGNQELSLTIKNTYMKDSRHGDEAIELAKKIEDDLIRSEALCEIVKELALAKHVDKALELVHTITIPDVNSKALNKVVGVLIQQEKIAEAIEIADGIKDLGMHSSVFNVIAQKLAEKGNINEALELSWFIKQDLSCENTICQMAKGLNIEGLLEAKRELLANAHLSKKAAKKLVQQNSFYEAIELAKAIEHDFTRDKTLIKVAMECEKKGNIDQAVEASSAIKREYDRYYALANTAIRLAGQGHIEKALEITGLIRVSFFKDQSLKVIARKLAKQNNIYQALGLTSTIEHESIKSVVFKFIAKQSIKLGNVGLAINAAQAIKNENSRKNALIGIIRELTKQGMLDKAVEVVQLVTVFKKEVGFFHIAKALAKNGNANQAIESLNCIQNEYTRFRYLNVIIKEMVQQKRISSAIGLANAIQKKFLRDLMISEMAKQLTNMRLLTSVFDLCDTIGNEILREETRKAIELSIAGK